MEPLKHGTTNTLSRGELRALISMENDDCITIKPSDKEGNIVILNAKAYEQMCLAILNDRSCYKVLPNNSMESFNVELQHLVD